MEKFLQKRVEETVPTHHIHSASTTVRRRRRGGTSERRRDCGVAFVSSSSGKSSLWDIPWFSPRDILLLAAATGPPFTAGVKSPEGPEPPLLPSRLPGRIANAEPLRWLRECRGVSRPSKYPLDWLERLSCGDDGVDGRDKVEVLLRLTPALRFPRDNDSLSSLDLISFPAMSLTRTAGSSSSSLIASSRSYRASRPPLSSLESQILLIIRSKFNRTAALL